MRSRSIGSAIAWGGLVAGVLDILDPIVIHGLRGVPPIRILQSVASGLLGPDAYSGGWPTAGLGLGLHFLIACTAAAVYVLASRRLRVLVTRPIVCGLAYGLVVWAVMRFGVLPLSAFRTGPFTVDWMLVNALGIHMLGVGLPIAFAARGARRES